MARWHTGRVSGRWSNTHWIRILEHESIRGLHGNVRISGTITLRSDGTCQEAGGKVQVDVQRHLRDGDAGDLLALRLRLRRVGVVKDVLTVLPLQRASLSRDISEVSCRPGYGGRGVGRLQGSA